MNKWALPQNAAHRLVHKRNDLTYPYMHQISDHWIAFCLDYPGKRPLEMRFASLRFHTVNQPV